MATDHGNKVNILLVVTTVASVLINIGQFVNSWELRQFKEKYDAVLELLRSTDDPRIWSSSKMLFMFNKIPYRYEQKWWSVK